MDNFLLPRDNPSRLESGAAASAEGGISYAPQGLFEAAPATESVYTTVSDDRASGGIDDQGFASAIPIDSNVTDTGDGAGAVAGLVVGGGFALTPGSVVYADLLPGIAADFALTNRDAD